MLSVSDELVLPQWTFLTNHAHVLVCIAQERDVRLAELARMVGIGERAVHRIVHDLVEAGYLTVRKEGRRNIYDIDLDRPLRHPVESAHLLRSIVEPLISPPGASTRKPDPQ
jgi:DNA-binding transcriptional regulator LsrR (DeoR family)